MIRYFATAKAKILEKQLDSAVQLKVKDFDRYKSDEQVAIEDMIQNEIITDIKNEETTSEEKQALFDYFIHSADLAHNTKKFSISLKWVELLSNEFWLQGDKEKKMNLSVSFLCDRDNTDVPKSQVGFIGGFIIPTFNFLIIMFPSLSFTVENAKNNLNEWQKLVNENRKKGWTPPKLKKNDDENKNKKEGNIKKKKETIFVDIKID